VSVLAQVFTVQLQNRKEVAAEWSIKKPAIETAKLKDWNFFVVRPPAPPAGSLRVVGGGPPPAAAGAPPAAPPRAARRPPPPQRGSKVRTSRGGCGAA